MTVSLAPANDGGLILYFSLAIVYAQHCDGRSRPFRKLEPIFSFILMFCSAQKLCYFLPLKGISNNDTMDGAMAPDNLL